MAKAKKSRAAKKKAWHIGRWLERCELAEDIRYDKKSPLHFIKDFVGGGYDSESCAYWLQIIALRGKANWLELRGGFAELKCIAGNQCKKYRGYLLDSNFDPASTKEIGRWLGVDERKASKILAELVDVGLLELVDLPDFEADGDRKASSKTKKKKKSPGKRTKAHQKKRGARAGTGTHGKARAGTGTHGKARAGTGTHGKPRAGTGTHGKPRAPLEKKTKGKTKIKIKVDAFGTDKSKRKKKENGNADALEQDKRKPEVKSKNAKPLPVKSRDVAKAGGRLLEFPVSPPAICGGDGPQSVRDGDLKHRYTSECKTFAADVYEALQLRFCPTSKRGRRECGCLGSMWERAEAAGLPPTALEELRSRAIFEAGKVAGRGSRCANRSAVWVHIFKRLLAAAGISDRKEIGGQG